MLHGLMRILILSSSTGGGHDMRARSLEAWCKELSSDSRPIQTHRYQALEESAGLYSFGVQLYNWIQKKCPWLHHVYFNWLELFQISVSETLLLGKAKYIAKLKTLEPDIIVSVHAHTNHAFRSIAKRVLPSVKFVTYCGEMHGGYGFSRHWVDPSADAFIGATPEICAAAEQLKMPRKKILHGGFLLNPNFYEAKIDTKARAQILRALDLEKEQFTLLLSTGANGALNHIPLLEALRDKGLKLQVIALCGRNEKARHAIEQWSESSDSITVRPLGYRDDMFELMQVSDAIVARPGTGTTSEAIMANCPLLLNTLGGVMPQEWITVKYLRANGLPAPRIKKPSDLAQQIAPLLSDANRLQNTKSQLRALQPKGKPQDVIAYLEKMTTEPGHLV